MVFDSKGLSIMSKFKIALIGGVLSFGLAAPAFAADLTPAPAPVGGFYVRGDLGWSWLTWRDSDNAFDVGGGVGYQWGPWFRSDVRVDWSGDYDIAPNSTANITTILGNGYLDIPLGYIFVPYVGAGAGYGWWNQDGGKDRDGFTYALMAGVSFDISEAVALDVGYRFRQVLDGPDPYDNSVLGGIRFKFW